MARSVPNGLIAINLSCQNQYLFREIVPLKTPSVISANLQKVFYSVVNRLQMERSIKTY